MCFMKGMCAVKGNDLVKGYSLRERILGKDGEISSVNRWALLHFANLYAPGVRWWRASKRRLSPQYDLPSTPNHSLYFYLSLERFGRKGHCPNRGYKVRGFHSYSR